MKIKTTMEYHFTFTRMAIIFLKRQNVLLKIGTSNSGRTLSLKYNEIKGDFVCLLSLHSNSPASLSLRTQQVSFRMVDAVVAPPSHSSGLKHSLHQLSGVSAAEGSQVHPPSLRITLD